MNGRSSRHPDRRAAVASALSIALVVASTVGIATPASADATVPNTPTESGLEVTLRAVATLPDSSIGTAPRLNGMAFTDDRLFVVAERDGVIHELTGDLGGPLTSTVFLDVAAAMATAGSPLDRTSSFHGGLRSVAFHPGAASNGRFYVSAMTARAGAPAGTRYLSDVAEPIVADSVLLEFRMDPTTGVADPASLREVFRVGMPVYDHPIKQIAFDQTLGPGDPGYGLLHIGHGDGSVQSAIAGGGQNPDALGKVLRIDPLAAGGEPYSVPSDNPFVGDPGMPDEVFSLGHRNPHSIAFATVDGRRVALVAEPGRDNVEEINLLTSGGDFGWPAREGTFVHRPEGGGGELGIDPLPEDEATFGFTYPVAQYATGNPRGERFGGFGVVGGFAIENGSALDGQFFFADFPTRGTLFHTPVDELAAAVTTLDTADPSRDEPSELRQAGIGIAAIRFDHDADPDTPALVRASLTDVFDDAPTYETDRADVRFGQGPHGELYLTSKRNNTVYLVLESVPPAGSDQGDDPDAHDDPDDGPANDEPARDDPGTIDDATSLAGVVGAVDYHPHDATVLRLYHAFFDREADLGGAKYWLEERRRGVSVEEMTALFATSPEFRLRYGDVDDAGFLDVVYANVLDRTPDAAGYEYWLGEMAAGLSRPDLVLMFSIAPEFIGLHPYGVPLSSPA